MTDMKCIMRHFIWVFTILPKYLFWGFSLVLKLLKEVEYGTGLWLVIDTLILKSEELHEIMYLQAKYETLSCLFRTEIHYS